MASVPTSRGCHSAQVRYCVPYTNLGLTACTIKRLLILLHVRVCLLPRAGGPLVRDACGKVSQPC